MRLRSKLIAVGLLLGAAAATGGVLLTLARKVPQFYRQAEADAGLRVAERSSELITRVQDLQNDIRTKPEWSGVFAAADLNCFLQEMICDRPGGESVLPGGCHSPRLAVHGDRVSIGFRYGDGFWSTIIWAELRVWLPKHDTNVIAVEVMMLNAGSLPISGQSFLDSIRDAAHEANVEVTWYRNEGRPVGLFRFYANQIRPATQIHTLKIGEGGLTIAGRTRLESTGQRD